MPPCDLGISRCAVHRSERQPTAPNRERSYALAGRASRSATIAVPALLRVLRVVAYLRRGDYTTVRPTISIDALARVADRRGRRTTKESSIGRRRDPHLRSCDVRHDASRPRGAWPIHALGRPLALEFPAHGGASGRGEHGVAGDVRSGAARGLAPVHGLGRVTSHSPTTRATRRAAGSGRGGAVPSARPERSGGPGTAGISYWPTRTTSRAPQVHSRASPPPEESIPMRDTHDPVHSRSSPSSPPRARGPARAPRPSAPAASAVGRGRLDRPRPSPHRPSPDACAKDSLALVTAGTLTIGTDNPAYPPYFAENADGTRPTRGSSATRPTATASRAPSASRSPSSSGFAKAEVAWVVVPVHQLVRPGPQDLRHLPQPGLATARARRRRPTCPRATTSATRPSSSLKDSPLAKATIDRRAQGLRLRRPGRHDELRRDRGRHRADQGRRRSTTRTTLAIEALKQQADRRPRRRPADRRFITASRSRTRHDRRPVRTAARRSTSAWSSTRTAR